MAKLTPLTTGVLEPMLQNETVEKPVLQILGAKKIAGHGFDRLRLLISDGKYFNSYAMLATQLNSLYDEGKLEENTIVRIDKYVTSMVNKSDAGKRVLVIVELTILHPGKEVGRKIGNPVTYTEGSASARSDERAPLKEAQASRPVEMKQSQATYNNNYANTSLNQSLSSVLTLPISSLSPYQNKWVIKARVTSKGPIRTWSNAKGEGKLFSMDLMDESGEIRATAFKEQCDKFYSMIEPGAVYFISKCTLKPANKQFSTLKNDYEMTFTNDTVVQRCEEDEESGIPAIKYDFVKIASIADLENKTPVDTIGICKEVGEVQNFTSRTTNKDFKKREIVLVDDSNASVNLTLWGDEAVNFDGYLQPTIAVKGARVNEFNGSKSLSMGAGASIKINPDIPESHRLKGWFDNGGGDSVTLVISAKNGAGGSYNTDWMSFHETRGLGLGDKADFFQCKATIHTIKTQNAVYKACPQEECNKKVVDGDNGCYRCERCNAQFTNFKYRLLLNMSIVDWSSNRWVTCFGNEAEKILQQSADRIGTAMEDGSNTADKIFSAAHFESYIFKLRCKSESYGDQTRVKMTVQSATPIVYKDYNKYLINNIQKLTGIEKN